MSEAVASLLAIFDQLSPEEQQAVSTAVLKRNSHLDCDEVSDDELTASASRIFSLLDEEEDADAR